MNLIDNDVHEVIMQFSFSGRALALPTLEAINNETPAERTERKSHATGQRFIEPTQNCDVRRFGDELVAAGFHLSQAIYQSRIYGGDPSGKTRYHMVRFVFTRHDGSNVSAESEREQQELLFELRRFCGQALWRVRAFLNPCYENHDFDRKVADAHQVSLNLEFPVPPPPHNRITATLRLMAGGVYLVEDAH